MAKATPSPFVSSEVETRASGAALTVRPSTALVTNGAGVSALAGTGSALGAAGSAATSSPPSVSNTTRVDPIAIWSPTAPAISITLPETGAAISTVALSVIMSATG